jgi:hypothetical protein
MVYLVFFLLCLTGVAIGTALFECRVRALTFGSLVLCVSYLFELRGIAQGDWSYEEVDSLLRITEVPIEILFGYFTAGFLLVLLVENLPDVSTVERRERFMGGLFLLLGIVILVHSYAFSSMSLAVGWAFLGIFGLLISQDRSVTLTVGICAFFADWAVEGVLTGGTQYYENHWDPTFALVFMFAGMFITGLWQNRQAIVGRIRPGADDAKGS